MWKKIDNKINFDPNKTYLLTSDKVVMWTGAWWDEFKQFYSLFGSPPCAPKYYKEIDENE